MTTYDSTIEGFASLRDGGGDGWAAISPESAARMRLQNRFLTGLDIARYTAKIMREDMANYDADVTRYTQSLGCWHGFIGQQKMIAVKKHHGTTAGRYLYLSGWMVAALRSQFGPLPDQSMHEKTAVPDLIAELYDFLKQADARELNQIFRDLDEARAAGDSAAETAALDAIDNFETHVVPIIADIDAGFGNEEACYLLAKKMIEAGACCIQVENQVSDAKQCGHQDGKVTVPHEDFLAKINAIRYAFLELGVDDGVIVARTDSLGAGLTQKLPVSSEAGDLASQYLAFLDVEPIPTLDDVEEGEVLIKTRRQARSPGAVAQRPLQVPRRELAKIVLMLDCITSLQNGADMLWIETATPNVERHRLRWSTASKKSCPTPSWSTTTRRRSTGRSTFASRSSTTGQPMRART